MENEVQIKQDLITYDEANFDIPYSSWIDYYNKVLIVDELNNQLFSGWIYELEPYFDKIGMMRIQAFSQKAIFKERKLLDNATYAGVNVATVIWNLLSEYVVYGDARQSSVSIAKDITIDLKIKDDRFSILDELAQQCECMRDVVDGTLYFGIIWTDKPEQEIKFDGSSLYASNIAGIKLVKTAKRANIAIWIDQNGNKTILSNNTWFVYGVVDDDFRDGDLTEKTQMLLNRSDQDQLLYQITVQNNTIQAKKGDRVRLRIENTIPIFNRDVMVYIIWINMTYSNAELQQEYLVSDVVARDRNLETTINGITKKLSLLTT